MAVSLTDEPGTAKRGEAPSQTNGKDGKMKKLRLIARTPHGEFTRESATRYTKVCVYACPRAMRVYLDPEYDSCSGVNRRFKKDRGFGVTWHKTQESAVKSAEQGYAWSDGHKSENVLLGIFDVEEQEGGK